jgi:hypothetical protein
MQLQAGMRRIQLEIESRRFHSLLLLASELGEAVGKRVRNPEFHMLSVKNLFHT